MATARFDTTAGSLDCSGERNKKLWSLEKKKQQNEFPPQFRVTQVEHHTHAPFDFLPHDNVRFRSVTLLGPSFSPSFQDVVHYDDSLQFNTCVAASVLFSVEEKMQKIARNKNDTIDPLRGSLLKHAPIPDGCIAGLGDVPRRQERQVFVP